MSIRFVCLLGLIGGLAASGFAQQGNSKAGTAEIQGRITGADSKTGLPGVVSWTRQITSEETSSPLAGAVLTDDTGAFRIPSLAAGTYVLCAEIPGEDYVNPCAWESVLPTVSVKAGQQVKNADLLVKPGIRLSFEVTDREKKVAGKGKTQGVRLGAYFVLPEGRRVELPLTRSEGDVHVLEAVVPADRDLPLVVEGQDLAFTDLEGKPWNVNRAAYVIAKPAAGEKQKRAAVEVKGR